MIIIKAVDDLARYVRMISDLVTLIINEFYTIPQITFFINNLMIYIPNPGKSQKKFHYREQIKEKIYS